MQYKKRDLEDRIKDSLKIFPVIAITGPRQAGKSTLIKHYTENSKEEWKYFSLDNFELRTRIKEDPDIFADSINTNIVIDEAQKAPELFHSLKELIDQGFPHKIILSGSANFLLMKAITESLAGRIGLLELLPFSLSEAYSMKSNNLITKILNNAGVKELLNTLNKIEKNKISNDKLLKFVLSGGYPRIHALKRDSHYEWFQAYISTYIEKDLRDLSQIGNLDAFQKVYRLLAFQTANILNTNSASSDIGVDLKTVKHYSSILETSYQCKFVPAYLSNIRKQLIKKPKVFYLDTGLVNYFLKNESVEEMLNKGGWGNILETYVFSQIYKETKDITSKPSLYFWRTNNGAEVDFIISSGTKLFPIEVKSAVKIDHYSIRGLKSFLETAPDKAVTYGIVLYRGKEIALIDKNIIAIPVNYLF